MANKLDGARRSLVRAREAAQQRLAEIENERRDIKASMKSLDTALKALSRPRESKNAAAKKTDTTVDNDPNQASNSIP